MSNERQAYTQSAQSSPEGQAELIQSLFGADILL